MLRQSEHCFLQHAAEFRFGYGLFWIESRDCWIHGNFSLIEIVVERLNALAFLPPRQRFMHRDSRQPGRERRAPLELAQMLVGADVRVLNHVFRLGSIAQNRNHHAVEPLVVPPHDDFI